jgi:hypothetical protein
LQSVEVVYIKDVSIVEEIKQHIFGETYIAITVSLSLHAYYVAADCCFKVVHFRAASELDRKSIVSS